MQRKHTIDHENETVREMRKQIFRDFKIDTPGVLFSAFRKDTNSDLMKLYKFM